MKTSEDTQVIHEGSANVTKRHDEQHNDTYNSLLVGCVKAGISVAKLCREAKVDRSLLVRWKVEEPKSIKIYLKLKETIERLSVSNQ